MTRRWILSRWRVVVFTGYVLTGEGHLFQGRSAEDYFNRKDWCQGGCLQMTELQTINSTSGKPEYVLLPMSVYQALHQVIDRELQKLKLPEADDYIPYDPSDYVDNPVALARLRAHDRQEELARLLDVTQAYISKVEHQENVTPKLVARVKEVLKAHGTKAG